MFTFPQPSGPYAIGTVTYHWVDLDRLELFSPEPDDHRELMVQIWYPAEDRRSSPRAPYMPDAAEVGPVLAGFLGAPASSLFGLKDVTTNAVSSAPVADQRATFPVIVLLVGIKGSYRQLHTFQVEELVSHGYVVAVPDQPYTAATVVFPDGRQVAYDERWDPPRGRFFHDHVPYVANDATFVLDQLAILDQADPQGILIGRLDLDRVGLIGHSFGAVIGGEACRLDPRFRTSLLEDAFMPASVVRAGLWQPTMFITRDAETMRLERREAGGWPESDIEETLSTSRAVYEELPDLGYYVEVSGMFHLDMTDAPFLAPFVPWPGLSGPIGRERVHRIINAYSLAFFDQVLRGESSSLLAGPSHPFPEARLEARRS